MTAQQPADMTAQQPADMTAQQPADMTAQQPANMTAQQLDDRAFYWDWAKHEENLLTNRGNFFLIGQSMLFAGVATLRSAQETLSYSVLPVFYFLGIFISLIWIGVGFAHNQLTRKQVGAALDTNEPRHKSIAENAWWLKSNFWMSIIMPIGILAAWVWLALPACD
jgi:hypothetical protein